jgi:signal transduction histidine kinase
MTQLPLETEPDILASRVLIESHRLLYAQLAPDLTLVRMSPGFEAVLSAPVANPIGCPVTELLWEFAGMEDALLALLRGDAPPIRLENVNREEQDGQLIYLAFQVLLLDADRPARGLLLLVENTTDHGHISRNLMQDRNQLRLLQDELAAANQDLDKLNKMKSLFLSMAAHDLRSPLSAISGYADLLLSGEIDVLTPQQREFLSIIRAQANRLSRLTFDLLNLDQIERGQLEISPTVCDLRELIVEATTVSRIEAELRQILLQCELPERSLYIWAEPDRVLQILYNLLGNALRYTRSSGLISVSAGEENGEVWMKIGDTGLGMTPDQVERLFTLYYRTEEVKRNQIKGTGLGLFIVKSLVDAHKGRIAVESQPNVGTTFTVWLPIPAQSERFWLA